MHGSQFVMPHNPGSFITGDGVPLVGDDNFLLLSEPYELDVVSWNIDTVNQHTIYLNVFIKPVWAFFPMSTRFLDILEGEEIRKVL